MKPSSASALVIAVTCKAVRRLTSHLQAASKLYEQAEEYTAASEAHYFLAVVHSACADLSSRNSASQACIRMQSLAVAAAA